MNGEIPYRDIWDHKPPLIYFVDAVGLGLTPDSLWGVWMLQFIFILLTLLFLYRLLEQEFGVLSGLAGGVIFTSGLVTILEQGNVTEEYALVFQVLGFLLFVRAWKQDFPIRTSFWIGLFGGLAFNFKQTTIGIGLTYGLFLVALRLWRARSPVRDLLSLLAGALLPSLIILLYFASQGALMDFWEQAYLYNFVYIGKHEGLRRLVPVFLKGFAYLRNGGVLYFAMIGWLAAAGTLWTRRKNFMEAHPLISITLVNLPVEILLILVSGRSILHYYLTPLPVMTILAAMLVRTVPAFVQNASPSRETTQKWISGGIVVLILLAQSAQIRNYPERIRVLSENAYAPVIEYVSNHTDRDDKVLVIGAESVVNFLARREAPTRYVYQYPLALLGRRPMFEEYFNEILENPPALIIDTRGRARLDEKLYEPLQKRSPLVRDGVRYLAESYQQVAQLGEWFVYRFAGE